MRHAQEEEDVEKEKTLENGGIQGQQGAPSGLDSTIETSNEISAMPATRATSSRTAGSPSQTAPLTRYGLTQA